MAGLADIFKSVLGGNGAGAADAMNGAAFVAEAVDAFSDARKQSLLANVIMPWALNVARFAAQKWNVDGVSCTFEQCQSVPVCRCFVCSSNVCLNHAFVGADATVICWPCIKNSTSNVGGAHNAQPPPKPKPTPEQVAQAYALLGASPNFSDDELKKLFKRALFESHPDRASNDDDAKILSEKFKMVQKAIEYLKSDRGIQ